MATSLPTPGEGLPSGLQAKKLPIDPAGVLRPGLSGYRHVKPGAGQMKTPTGKKPAFELTPPRPLGLLGGGLGKPKLPGVTKVPKMKKPKAKNPKKDKVVKITSLEAGNAWALATMLVNAGKSRAHVEIVGPGTAAGGRVVIGGGAVGSGGAVIGATPGGGLPKLLAGLAEQRGALSERDLDAARRALGL